MLLLNSVLPTFFIIALGWLLGHFKVLTEENARQLSLYVFWVAAPAIIFVSISQYDLQQIFVWQFWLAHILSILLLAIFTMFAFYFVFKSSGIEAMMAGLTATVKNTIMIGFPILTAIVGPKAAIPMAVTVVVFNCILTPILLFTFEVHKVTTREGVSSWQILLSSFYGMVKNPMVVAAFLGVIFSWLKWTLPVFLNLPLHYIAPSFVPCALVAVGIGLKAFSLSGNKAKIVFIAFANLVLCPVIAIALAYLLNLSAFYAISLVVLSSMPTAKTMYVYASKYGYFQQETAAIISLTTLVSIISIPIFIYLCQSLWPL